jgi:hypothetical protein
MFVARKLVLSASSACVLKFSKCRVHAALSRDWHARSGFAGSDRVCSAATMCSEKSILCRAQCTICRDTFLRSVLQAEARADLLKLQEEVEEAHRRLHLTQARVEQNVKMLTELKAEAAHISRINNLSAQDVAAAAKLSSHPEAAEVLARPLVASQASKTPAMAATATAVVPVTSPATVKLRKSSRGLSSSLSLEPGLRDFWSAPLLFFSRLDNFVTRYRYITPHRCLLPE